MAKKKDLNKSAAASNSLVSRDIFDASFFGTNLRMSIVIYIVAAIAVISFFLPFLSDTPQSRNLNLTDGHSYNSTVSDMKWNEAVSTGFDMSMGKKVPYVKESTSEYTIRLPLTNDGYVMGKNVRDTFLYLSYGNLLFILVPLIAIYVIILNTCRSQWQKGGAFLINAITSVIAIGIHILLVYQTASNYNTNKPSARQMSSRIGDIISRLGVGYYISFIAFVVLLVLCVYGFVAIKTNNSYPIVKNNAVKEAPVAEEIEEEAAEAAVEA